LKDTKEISNLVEREIDRITETKVRDRVRELLVVPCAVERLWDYGQPGQHFICWTVLEQPLSDTGIAFCGHGFGPAYRGESCSCPSRR
jgi:hypothetical protein